tara:strand:- start:31402 stop:32514 length:1113 start_codon:yes stop_codon:yes gene_type:complete
MSKIINIFDKEESNASKKCGTFATQAFSWQYANNVGFKTYIKSTSEIENYIDTMQENRFDDNIQTGLLGKITDSELALLHECSKKIFNFSKQFSYRTFSKNSLSRSLVQYRLIDSLIQKGKILEIGPGSGMLGVLIGMSNKFSYTGMETCQAFYITQHELWKSFFGKDFDESFKNFKNKKINHLPWWNFVDQNFSLPKYDCVTANHVFAEMNLWGLKFTIKKLHSILREDGLVIIESMGNTSFMSIERVLDEFLANNFSILHIGKMKEVTNFNNIYILKKSKNKNCYSVNPHLFIRVKGNYLKLRSLRKSLGHLKRGVLKDFKIYFEKIKLYRSSKKIFNKKDIIQKLSNYEKQSNPSKNDIFRKYIAQG